MMRCIVESLATIDWPVIFGKPEVGAAEAAIVVVKRRYRRLTVGTQPGGAGRPVLVR
jgi:hypothetical protein